MKILHNFLKGISLTGALFVFQACYGIAEPPLYEEGGTARMSFTLVSHKDGKPLEGINVMGSPFNYPSTVLGVTDANGHCTVEIPYRRNIDGPYLRFEDNGGNFIAKDTTLTDLRERDILIKMDPAI